jgi:hypothetical protein
MRWPLLCAALILASPALAARRAEPEVIDDALAFVTTDRTKTIRLLEDAIENDASLNAHDRALVMLHVAEQRRLQGAAGEARRWLDDAKKTSSEADILTLATLSTVLLDARAPLAPPLRASLKEPSEKGALATQNADRYALLAVDAAYANDLPAVKDYARRALSFSANDPDVERRIRLSLEALAGGKPPPPVAPPHPLDRAEALFAEGQRDAALTVVREFLAAPPESGHDVRVGRYLQRRIEANTVVHPERIGVLLPLSGKYEQAGKQMRQAIELGFGAAAPHANLVFADAGETPETVVAGLEQLVFEQGAVAVLGPLRNEGTAQAVEAAEAMRVPLLTLSQSPEAAGGSAWAIQGMPTVRDQIAALLAFAMQPPAVAAVAEPLPQAVTAENPPPPPVFTPLSRFAIFAPDNAYGRSAAAEFRSEAEKRGATIWRETFYSPEATDLVPFAKTLGGEELSARRATVERWRADAKRRGVKATTTPLEALPFDAIFLPDSAQRIPLACAALAFVEIPVGDFQPVNEPRKVPLLGLSGWSNEALIDRGGLYVQNSVFTDLWYARDPEAQSFLEPYRSATTRTPTALEASAHDLGALLRQAIDTRPASYGAFVNALRGVRLDAAATPTVAVAANRLAVEHPLRVLTIEGREIRRADASSGVLAAPGTTP